MLIIWPQKDINELFGTPEETLWGCGRYANLVYIKTQNNEWFEGTADVGGFKKDSNTWNVAVWIPRAYEFVENWKQHNATQEK